MCVNFEVEYVMPLVGKNLGVCLNQIVSDLVQIVVYKFGYV